MARKKQRQQQDKKYQFPTYCERCGAVLFDEHVSTDEGIAKMKKCIICGARYFERVQMPKTICKMCGKEMNGKYKRKYCIECLRKKTNKKLVKTCIRCGEKFIGFKRTKYCKHCLVKVLSEASQRRRKNAVSIS